MNLKSGGTIMLDVDAVENIEFCFVGNGIFRVRAVLSDGEEQVWLTNRMGRDKLGKLFRG